MAGEGEVMGGIAQVGLGLIGNERADREKEEQRLALLAALAEYDSLEAPDDSPELLGPSAYEGIQMDPAYREAQMEALAQLQELVGNGGMTLEDEANLANIQNRSARAEKSAREGIRESMAAKGISGGGSELAMNLAAQQGAANRSASAGLEVAAAAQKRALDAMLARGRMAGDIRGQEFGEKARGADARDSIARYNAGSRAAARQQGFTNRLNLAGAKAGARSPMAGYHAGQAQDARGYYAGLGMAAAEGGRAFDAYDRRGESSNSGASKTSDYDYDSLDRPRRMRDDGTWED